MLVQPVSLPRQGEVLAAKYRIERLIGEGGMGVVYEAFHLRLRQRVAIKMLRPNILAHPELVARFEREARAAATLESPQVARVLDVDTSPEGLPYMVIEFLEGNDLAEELARRGRFPVQEAVAYVLEACVPIAQAHALGIIHRDLKPSNLFLAKKGGERVLKLLDFGISKVLTEADAKDTLGMLGTPHYMSPEHVRSAADVDRRSDIWSLGIILYELLTGTEPFAGDPPRVIAAIVADPVPPPRTRRPDIPEALERAIMRALEKDPQKRFPDVRSLVLALRPFVPEEAAPFPLLPHAAAPVAAAHATVAEPVSRPVYAPRRRWALPAVVATLAVVILARWASSSSAKELPPAPPPAVHTSVLAPSVTQGAAASARVEPPHVVEPEPVAPARHAASVAPKASSAAPTRLTPPALGSEGIPFQL